jgi:hypothetical protein
MVTRIAPLQSDRRKRGALSTELVVAIAILVAVTLPLSYGWIREARALRAGYWRAVAVEIVDGELEVLAAGEWRHFAPGSQPYPVTARAATNLPPGKFALTLENRHVRLEWKSDRHLGIGAVVRETEAK